MPVPFLNRAMGRVCTTMELHSINITSHKGLKHTSRYSSPCLHQFRNTTSKQIWESKSASYAPIGQNLAFLRAFLNIFEEIIRRASHADRRKLAMNICRCFDAAKLTSMVNLFKRRKKESTPYIFQHLR